MALTATCNFATASKQLKQVEEDLCQQCKDYNDVVSFLRSAKSDVMRLKKELTTTKKKGTA
jgi:cell shape-determining protein MreC